MDSRILGSLTGVVMKPRLGGRTCVFWFAVSVCGWLACRSSAPRFHGQKAEKDLLSWSDEIPPLPDSIGVAGPFVGVHGDALVVAGGATLSTTGLAE